MTVDPDRDLDLDAILGNGKPPADATAERWIVIPRWDDFQHADATKRGRDPIWIKNYTRLLSDDNYLTLTLTQRAILHGIWMSYARGGRVLRETIARRSLVLRQSDAKYWTKNIDAIAQAGFIELRQDCPVLPVSSLDKRREEQPSSGRGLSGNGAGPTKKPWQCPECPIVERGPNTLRSHLEILHDYRGNQLDTAIEKATQEANR